MNVSFRLPSTSTSNWSSSFDRFPRVFSRNASSMSITSRAPSRSTNAGPCAGRPFHRASPRRCESENPRASENCATSDSSRQRPAFHAAASSASRLPEHRRCQWRFKPCPRAAFAGNGLATLRSYACRIAELGTAAVASGRIFICVWLARGLLGRCFFLAASELDYLRTDFAVFRQSTTNDPLLNVSSCFESATQVPSEVRSIERLQASLTSAFHSDKALHRRILVR